MTSKEHKKAMGKLEGSKLKAMLAKVNRMIAMISAEIKRAGENER